MTKITVKRKWVQKMTKHDMRYFSSLHLIACGSHSLHFLWRNLILLAVINSNTNINQQNSVRL